jgi:hypothetical protein
LIGVSWLSPGLLPVFLLAAGLSIAGDVSGPGSGVRNGNATQVEDQIRWGDDTLSAEETTPEDENLPEDWQQRLEMLRSVPYLSLSETEAEESDSSVTLYIPDKTYDGYNFYNSITFRVARLFDMEGREVHQWQLPPFGESKKDGIIDYSFMLPDGDLMNIRRNSPQRPESVLMRIDWDSNVLWQKDIPVHHDVTQAPDGTFYTLYREIKEHRGLRVKFCGIVHLEDGGKELDRWSTHQHLDDIMSVLDTRSFLDTVLDSVARGWSPQGHELDAIEMAKGAHGYAYDYFHMNTVSLLPVNVLESRDDRFREGNLLVCFRNVNQIAVLERSTYRVLWAWGEGILERPHHPTLLDNGHILIFDNGVQRQYSRVVEMDPLSGTIVWEYQGTPPESFFSAGRGSSQRLPNGNTLVCNSDQGQAFEVTADGEMVWLWWNPFIKSRRREAVYRMIRYPVEMVESLLRAGQLEDTGAPLRQGDGSAAP